MCPYFKMIFKVMLYLLLLIIYYRYYIVRPYFGHVENVPVVQRFIIIYFYIIMIKINAITNGIF